jgi:hypothetical protein
LNPSFLAATPSGFYRSREAIFLRHAFWPQA